MGVSRFFRKIARSMYGDKRGSPRIQGVGSYGPG